MYSCIYIYGMYKYPIPNLYNPYKKDIDELGILQIDRLKREVLNLN